jgi:hypothetical protein
VVHLDGKWLKQRQSNPDCGVEHLLAYLGVDNTLLNRDNQQKSEQFFASGGRAARQEAALMGLGASYSPFCLTVMLSVGSAPHPGYASSRSLFRMRTPNEVI